MTSGADRAQASLSSHPALTLSLQGTALIEASAGTGKTWSVAKLFLRALIEKRLMPSSVLVMTFTRAATRELNERLLSEVHEFSIWLALKPPHEFYSQWWQTLSVDIQKNAKNWVGHCLLHFDEASIGTLQSFCEQIIQRYGFQFHSGLAPDSVIESTSFSSNGVSQAVASIYGKEVAFINRLSASDPDRARAALCKEALGSYEDILSAVMTLLQKPAIEPTLENSSDDSARLAICNSESVHTLALFRAVATHEAIADFLDFGRHYLNSAKANKKVSYGQFAELAQEMRLLAKTGSFQKASPFKKKPPNAASKSGDAKARYGRSIDRMISGVISKIFFLSATGERLALVDLPLVSALTAFRKAHENDSEKFDSYWAEIVIECRRFALTNMLRGSDSSFDETSLSFQRSVLLVSDGLQRKPEIASAVRKRYPIALIDEFQDTDPVQSKIITAVYPPQYSEDYSLVMVGDPKQAIYNFRGADVYAYLAAKVNANKIYTLSVNQRSVAPLISEVNAIFSQESLARPFGVFDTHGIAFVPALASNRHELAHPLPALRYVKVDTADVNCWQWTAKEINRLIKSKEGVASDIAVLVRANSDVTQMKAALTELGISSRVQDKSSIWLSASALQMQWFLQGLLHFENLTLLRRALMTQFGDWACGKRNLDLIRAVDDKTLASIAGLRAIWIERGVAALWAEINRLRIYTSTNANITASKYADINADVNATTAVDSAHLMELTIKLGQGSVVGDHGASRLLEKIAKNISDAKEKDRLQIDGEDSKRRTPATINQVQVLTVHRSKGLQFNIVFLPKLGKKPTITRSFRAPVFYPEKNNRSASSFDLTLNVDLSSKVTRSAQIDSAVEQEEAREDTRLAYVALTRAVRLCYWLIDNEKSRSEIGELIFKQSESHEAKYGMYKPEFDSENEDCLQSSGSEVSLTPADNFDRQTHLLSSSSLQPRWSIESFSLLAQRGGNEIHRGPDVELELIEETTSMPIITAAIGHDLTRLPKGPRTGECIHDALERCDWQTSMQAPSNEAILRSSIQRFGLSQLQSHELGGVVQNTINTPLFVAAKNKQSNAALMNSNFSLAQLNPSKVIREWRFDIAQFQKNSYLRGFVDLVFEHDGRFFVVDYKSNWLGPNDDSYSQQAMKEVMLSHQYDLQAKIYSAALRNFLAVRLGPTQAKQAFGGVFYLFIRAMRPDIAGSGVFYLEA